MHGLPNHLDLTVTDLARSTVFYDLVLTTLGYARSKEYAGEVPCWVIHMDVQVQKPSLFTISPQDPQERLSTPKRLAFSIGLHKSRSDRAHDRYAAGLHHLALHASSRIDVDAFHALLVSEGIAVLDAPAEYDYTPGYYAVFFADPDGMKLELVYEPRFDVR